MNTLKSNLNSKLLISLYAFSIAMISSALIGCSTNAPVNGLLYADVAGPVTATNAMRGNLRGESCASSYLSLIALGDASISAASKAGGINQISHVDHTWSNILGIYSHYCTIVWGSKGGPMIPAKVPAPAAVPAPMTNPNSMNSVPNQMQQQPTQTTTTTQSLGL